MDANLFLGRDAFIDFSVSVTGILLVIPALFWLYFGEHSYTGKTSTEDKDLSATARVLFWIVLIPLGILVGPVSSAVVQKLIENQPYIDIMIGIPTALVTCFSFIHLTEHFHIVGKTRIGALICLSALIITSSSVFMTPNHPIGIEFISNSMKISPETQTIAKTVGSDYVLLPEELYGQINEYDSGLHAESLANVTHDWNYTANVANTAVASNALYVVIRKVYDNPDLFEDVSYKKETETKHYIIYRYSASDDTQSSAVAGY